jgi:hypothetical protein
LDSNFMPQRHRTRRPLAPLEEAAVRIAFTDKDHEDETVSLSNVRRRLMRGLKQFSAEVNRELLATGFLDEDRRRVRDRYAHVSLTLVVLGSAGLIGAAFLVPRYGGWPLLVPGALSLQTEMLPRLSPYRCEGFALGVGSWRLVE